MDQQPLQDQQMPPASEAFPAKPLDDVEENKDIAALSYAWILSLVVFFTRRNSPFVRFHAKQGIVLFILSIAFWMVPFVGRMLELVVLAFCALGFINAAQGKWKDLPLIGAAARGDWKAVRESWKSVVHGIAESWRHFRKEKPAAAQTSPVAPSESKPADPVPSEAQPAPAADTSATGPSPETSAVVPPSESL